MQYILKNERMSVTIDALGAELISVVKDGKERIWQNPTGEWAGHSPLLFPVCGHCGVTVDGISYPIGMHGVARKSVFTLVEQTPTSVRLSIQSNEDTLRVYPYAFVFEVAYCLDGDTLHIEFDVKNPVSTPLYFACGSHESYALDENVDGYAIEFDKEETLTHYPHNDGGVLSGEKVDYGTRKVLPLPRDVLQDGNTLIFKDIQSRKVRLMKTDGTPLADVCFEGFSNLLFWRALDAKYICIEPWTNLPDLAGVPDVEFSQKEGVMKVEGGASKKMVHSITYY